MSKRRMGKGNYRPTRPKTLQGKSATPTQKRLEFNADQFMKHVMDNVEKRVRIAELKAQMIVGRIEERMDVVQANQAVTQQLIGRKGIFTAQEFQTEFERYVEEELGVVENGRMRGTVFIDFFNVGRKPIATSTVSSHTGKGPIFVE